MAKDSPKRIAGVKVPKRMRKSLGKTARILQHPVVADLVAAALLSAAAAIRENKTIWPAARKAKDRIAEAADDVAAVGTTKRSKNRKRKQERS